MQSILRILILAAEAAPWVKIGGLGDVAGSLPAALKGLSGDNGQAHVTENLPQVDVRLVIPFHGAIQRQHYPLRSLGCFQVPYNGGSIEAEALEIDGNNFPVYLISGELIPADSPVYSLDAGADGLKFTFFSMAALELVRRLNWTPHVVHANDWHTAPAVYSLGTSHDLFYKHTASVLGVHNLPYLGHGAGGALTSFGMHPSVDSRLPGWARSLPLPLGLLSADHIVAVSPSYAQEILTPEFGAGLDGFLRARSDHISGILNGLDETHWDPKNDGYLVACYDRASLAERAENKLDLQTEFDLERDHRKPLVALVSRMDYQKGIDLVPEAFRIVMSSRAYSGKPWQLIVLGAGDRNLETLVRQFERDLPNRVRAVMRFDVALSHRIYAGADILLIPSRYEPCGMTQMIAMHYGCVPVASATGGLRDTIIDYNRSGESTGFLFRPSTPEALAEAIVRALVVYEDQRVWKGLQRRGMKRDFSWKRSAKKYLGLYLSLIRR